MKKLWAGWSWAWVLVRLVLLCGVFSRGTGISYVFGASEALALGTTVYALLAGRVDYSARGALVPLFYCVPLLFDFSWPLYPDFVQSREWAGNAYLLLCPFQWFVRARLGSRCTVSAPVYVSLYESFPYSLVRHPLGTLEILLCLLLALWWSTAWNWAVFAMCAATGLLTMLLEEKFLRLHPPYVDYCERVRWRCLPGIF